MKPAALLQLPLRGDSRPMVLRLDMRYRGAELSSPTGFPFRFIRRTLEAQHKPHLDGIRPSVSVPYSVSCVAINAVKRAASNHDRSKL